MSVLLLIAIPLLFHLFVSRVLAAAFGAGMAAARNPSLRVIPDREPWFWFERALKRHLKRYTLAGYAITLLMLSGVLMMSGTPGVLALTTIAINPAAISFAMIAVSAPASKGHFGLSMAGFGGATTWLVGSGFLAAGVAGRHPSLLWILMPISFSAAWFAWRGARSAGETWFRFE